MFQTAFRKFVPNAVVRSMYEISGFGQKVAKGLLPSGTFFEKGIRIINFTDGSFYVSEHDGYFSGDFIPTTARKHVQFSTPPAFIVYPEARMITPKQGTDLSTD